MKIKIHYLLWFFYILLFVHLSELYNLHFGLKLIQIMITMLLGISLTSILIIIFSIKKLFKFKLPQGINHNSKNKRLPLLFLLALPDALILLSILINDQVNSYGLIISLMIIRWITQYILFLSFKNFSEKDSIRL